MPLFFFLLLLLLSMPAAWALEGYVVEEVVTFAAPDSSYEALRDFVASASLSLYVNVYTFTSLEVAELLVGAEHRGVEVVLMVERAPVGGISDAEREVLRRLLDAGVEVYLSSNPGYRFNHAKYAVADNASVLVTSENFGYNSFPLGGSGGNRGWGVVIRDAEVASYFLDLFLRDLGEAEKVREVEAEGRQGRRTIQGYKPRFKKKLYNGRFVVKPFVAPEEAVESILELISSANRSLYVEQFYIYKYWGPRKTGSPTSTPNLFLEAVINASRRGVEVKILLDSTGYNVEAEDPVSNYNTLLYLKEVSRRENLDLEARLADPGLKIHNKGLIIDGELVLISSVNWNEHSPTKNREIGVIIRGAPAGYFAEVFMYDWRGGAERDYSLILPGVLLLLLLLVIKFFFKKN